MKRVFALVLTLVLSLSLAACSGSTRNGDAGEQPEAQAEPEDSISQIWTSPISSEASEIFSAESLAVAEEATAEIPTAL